MSMLKKSAGKITIMNIESIISSLLTKKGLWYGLMAFGVGFLSDLRQGKVSLLVLPVNFLVTVGTCILVHDALLEIETMAEITRGLWTFSAGVFIVAIVSVTRTAIYNPLTRIYLLKALLGYKGIELKELDDLIKEAREENKKEKRDE